MGPDRLEVVVAAGAERVSMTIGGTCLAGFDDVRVQFERNFAQRGEVGASVCVFVDGEMVVDLWGGVADQATGASWGQDTVGLVFSCTKGATALCAHLLVDRGELDLFAPVSRYWAEFGAAGKQDIPVGQLLNHQAGLPALRAPIPANGYDWDAVVAALAAEAPFWEPGTRHGYHGITFGWLVGEVIRRISGRSVGAFFRDEVAGPLGLDFWIGLPEEIEPRMAPTLPYQPGPDFRPSRFHLAATADPTSIPGLMTRNSGGYVKPADWDSRAAHASESPAVNGVSNARGLAGMYLPLSIGGDGLLSADTVARMGAVSSASSLDATMLEPTRFTLGYMKSVDARPTGGTATMILSEDAFGHPGAGGSLGFADPVARLAFGYTMNQHGPNLMLDDRAQLLVDAAYRALGYRSNESGAWTR
jgi:CubicO group peptidase (beta-lactamase class C family)